MKPLSYLLLLIIGMFVNTPGFGSSNEENALKYRIIFNKNDINPVLNSFVKQDPKSDSLVNGTKQQPCTIFQMTENLVGEPTIVLDPPGGLGQEVEIYTDCGPPDSFTISGTNLTSDLVVAWENVYGYAELCLTENGQYVTSLTLTNNGGTIGPTQVFVRLCMQYTSEAQALIKISGSGILQYYPVWNTMLPGTAPVTTIGNVISQPDTNIIVPVTAVDFEFISFATYQIEYNPDVLVFQSVQPEWIMNVYDEFISEDVRRLTVGLGSTSDYCWSVPDNDTIFSLVFQYNGGTSDLTFVDPPGNDFQKCYYLLPVEEPFEDYHNNGSVSESPPPVIIIDPPSGLGQEVEIYTDCGPPNSFIVSGSNLTTDMIIAWENVYGYAELCLTEDGEYVTTLTLENNEGTIGPTQIFVRLCMQYTSEAQAFISISSSGTGEMYPVWNSMLPGDTPVTTIANVTAEPGNTVVVPVTVVDFDNISFATYQIEYNPNVLTLQNVTQEEIFGFYDEYISEDTRRISIGIGSTSDNCGSFPDNDTLFGLVFFYNGGTTDLTFSDPPGNDFQKCYYILPNEEPFGDYHHNGSVSEVIKEMNLKLYLESLYNPATGRMNKVQGAAGDRFPGDTTDVVTVKLAQTEHPYPTVASFENVALKQNGTISIQLPDSLNGDYYIMVSHRNSIDTWSAMPVGFSGNEISYDFTNDEIKAYGKNLKLTCNTYGIYSGDADHNGIVDTGDISMINNDASGFASGYLATDLNGDGIVDTGDLTIADNNSVNYIGVACPDVQDLPAVITTGITNVTQSTANSGGHVYCSGGTCVTTKGVCWDTEPNPVISDDRTIEGSGSCLFVSNLFGLTPGTQYYLRAYATNCAGTAYGNEIGFTTSLVTAGKGTTDIDSNSYTTLILGSQEWMAANLKSTRYANGDVIPIVTANTEWSSLETGACCWYNNDNQYEDPYGKLYNWHAVNDTRNLCPDGWHIPTDADWTVLINYLGGENVADGKMKEAGFAHWNAPNSEADNSSGFTGLPGGSRYKTGTFSYMNSYGYWWSSNEKDACTAWCRSLGYNYEAIVRISQYKKNGISIRCLRQLSPPDPYTASVSGITETSAKGGGNILSDGGAPVDLGGICWSTSANPTTTDNHTTDGSGTGAFTSNITNLAGNTLYYVRAYATNSVGTAYGNEVSFRTLPAFECGSELTVSHLISGGVAPVNKTVSYGTVDNMPGEPSKCWITSNLGADHQAITMSDTTEAAAGWYWQFNRAQGYRHDGIIRTPADWITSVDENSDWQVANDPCTLELGSGWRIPTLAEWCNVQNVYGNCFDWSRPGYAEFKIHAAGHISYYDGSLYHRGEFGYYWSSSQSSNSMSNNTYCNQNAQFKMNGFSIRCLRDDTGTSATLPVLTTGNISDITINSAICGGNITNDGGASVTVCGVCWSTSTGPTINNNHTSDGFGTGSYTSTLTGLSSGTVYYVRAYATNRAGIEYGNEVSFTTE
ncbi:MAG: FISUMP domain-containing protein [Lentimicrobium sp.]